MVGDPCPEAAIDGLVAEPATMPMTARSTLLPASMLAAGLCLGLLLGHRVSPTHLIARDDAPRPAPAAVDVSPRPAGDEEAVYRELARGYEGFRAIDRTFERVSKAVAPAVVHIVAHKAGRRENGQAHATEDSGSGVILRPAAGKGLHVLTNNHVVEGAGVAQIQVVLQDGRSLRPDRVWSDRNTDIAVLHLAAEGLPTARLGDSEDAPVGTWVLAMGSPFGLTHSVSTGIISARMRHEEEMEDLGVINQGFLQTDAAINPGNSGGPLVNMKGEVIGINVAIATNHGGNEGVGFSIPSNLARWAMDQLVARGKVSRGAIGVTLQSLTPQQAVDLGLGTPRGARIQTITRGLPAAEAGLREGDIVLVYNGVEVASATQFINNLSMTVVGQRSDLVVWRDGRSLELSVRIMDRDLMQAQRPGEPSRGQPTAPPRRSPRPAPVVESPLGVELVLLDVATARKLGLPESTRGVAVARVEPTSPLAGVVEPRDLLESVGGRAVKTVEEALRALGRRVEGTPLEVNLRRKVEGGMRAMSVSIL